MLLIDDILLSPWRGLIGIFEQINDMAQKEISDDEYALEKLMELQLRYEMGEIGSDEYNREESRLRVKFNDLRDADQE